MPAIHLDWAMTRNIFGVIAALFAAWFFLDSYFAHADELDETNIHLEQYKVQTIETMQDFRVNYIVDQLNDLQAKDTLDELTPYDNIKKQRLENELQVLTR